MLIQFLIPFRTLCGKKEQYVIRGGNMLIFFSKIRSYLNLFLKLSLFKTVYYSLKFNSVIFLGKGSIINLHKNAHIIVNKGRLNIGLEYTLPQKTVIDIHRNAKFIINGMVNINKGTKIMIGENASLKIGNKTYINEHSRIQCRNNIEIGESCAIAWSVNILDTDEHSIITNKEKKKVFGNVKIGNNVWIGCNSIVLKDVEIGNGVVIGAGTIVTKDIPSNCLAVGSPAKVLKENVIWE
jgi:acetyltransferase-like isoleucine patch superfamily enzyme